MTFRGTFTVTITPFDRDDRLDVAGLARFVEWQVAEGIHGLIPLGSTGEFLSLSNDETTAVIETVVRAAGKRVPVVVGTGAEDTREVVRRSREAERLGADGVMIIPPFYSTPSEDELYHHYKTAADAIGIPVMIYNNPAVTNVDLTPPIVARLSTIEGCQYIKESTLEITRVRDIMRLCGDRLTVFGGVLGFESFVEGAQGWVAVASNVAPGPMAKLFELVADHGKIMEARALYLHWLPIIEAVFGPLFVGGTKSLLNHMGFEAGHPRPPRLPLPAALDERMSLLVREFDLRFPRARSVRLATSGLRCSILVDDEPIEAVSGETVAVALFANGQIALSTGADGRPRGAFCGMGVCHDCIVTIDGRAGQRACLTVVEAGMRVTLGVPYRPDIGGLADLAALPSSRLAIRETDVAVVGAGPGGLSAAIAAAEAGLRVIVLDERPRPGGQFYKQPLSAPPFGLDRQSREGAALIRRAQQAGAAIEPGTLVWGAFRDQDRRGELGLMQGGVASRLSFRWLVVATGAFERPQVVPGWTLPGVMTTGACQTLVRSYAVSPGRRVLFAGNGPLQMQTAAELLRAGGGIAAVASPSEPFKAVRDGLTMVANDPFLVFQGLSSVIRLRRGGVPLLWGFGLKRIEGEARSERAVLAPIGPDGRFIEGRDQVVDVDAVCLGESFAAASELPRLLGCAHEVPPGRVDADVRRADDGSTSVPDVFVVGEAGGFGGAQIALAQGTLAGAEIARHAGRPSPSTHGAQRALGRAQRFQTALWSAFAAKPQPPAVEDLIICRCEGLSREHVAAIARERSVRDLAALKRLSRAGMGRCQGRYCLPHLTALLGIKPETERDLLAPQMPLRPVPLAALSVEKPEWGGHRRSMLPMTLAPVVEPLPLGEAATLIIGAGIVGLSTAYFLAKAGHDVVVLDAGRPNAMASGGNAGSLHVQLLSFDFGAKAEAGGSPAARTLPLQRDAVALWRALEKEMSGDFEIKITGGVMVAENENDLRFLQAKTALERAQGIDSEMIGREDLERLEPSLGAGLIGAAYCSQEGKINPLVATQSILEDASRAGARLFDLTRVEAIKAVLAGFVVTTNRGEIRAGRVVNAAGAFASGIAALLGLDVPVFGAPLQMVVTEPVSPFINGLVAHADRHLTLKQAANGNILIGGGWTATLDAVHQHPRPLRESLEGNLWIAQNVVPALRRMHVLRSWAAMNVNIDGAPIIGEHPTQPGFFNAVTSNGYTLGPVIGQLTADLILRGRTDRDIEPFSIERFRRSRCSVGLV